MSHSETLHSGLQVKLVWLGVWWLLLNKFDSHLCHCYCLLLLRKKVVYCLLQYIYYCSFVWYVHKISGENSLLELPPLQKGGGWQPPLSRGSILWCRLWAVAQAPPRLRSKVQNSKAVSNCIYSCSVCDLTNQLVLACILNVQFCKIWYWDQTVSSSSLNPLKHFIHILCTEDVYPLNICCFHSVGILIRFPAWTKSSLVPCRSYTASFLLLFHLHLSLSGCTNPSGLSP